MIPSRPIMFISAVGKKFRRAHNVVATSYKPGWQHSDPTAPVSPTRANGKPVR